MLGRVDVDDVKRRRADHRTQRRLHLVAQMAIGAGEQGQMQTTSRNAQLRAISRGWA